MITSSSRPSTTATAPSPTGGQPKRRRRIGHWVLPIWSWAVILWLSFPIIVMIVFGFNDTTGKFNIRWQGFTLRWYRDMFAIPELTQALVTSVLISITVTIIATTLGTLMGVGLGRYKLRGSGAINLLIFAVIAGPEISIGAALLDLFLMMRVPRGFWTIVIAQVMFCIAYVAITVRARMAGLDRSLEDAARDLGAGPMTTFFKITLPLIFPGVVAGALLTFALSIDNYIITSFNAGSTMTFPLWVYSAARFGVPPQVNVIGTVMFVLGVLVAVGVGIANRRRR